MLRSPQILAALPVDWQGIPLLACSCLRVVFIPLFILCVYPSGTPVLRHPAWSCIFSLLMGISNGYFGSVPMILAAGKVSPRQRELAGKTPFCWHPAGPQDIISGRLSSSPTGLLVPHCQTGKPRYTAKCTGSGISWPQASRHSDSFILCTTAW